MPDWKTHLVGWSLLIAISSIVIAIGAAAVSLFGFAWGVAVCWGVGYLMLQAKLDRPAGGCIVVVGWILLAIGVAVGLVLQLVPQ